MLSICGQCDQTTWNRNEWFYCCIVVWQLKLHTCIWTTKTRRNVLSRSESEVKMSEQWIKWECEWKRIVTERHMSFSMGSFRRPTLSNVNTINKWNLNRCRVHVQWIACNLASGFHPINALIMQSFFFQNEIESN